MWQTHCKPTTNLRGPQTPKADFIRNQKVEHGGKVSKTQPFPPYNGSGAKTFAIVGRERSKTFAPNLTYELFCIIFLRKTLKNKGSERKCSYVTSPRQSLVGLPGCATENSG